MMNGDICVRKSAPLMKVRNLALHIGLRIKSTMSPDVVGGSIQSKAILTYIPRFCSMLPQSRDLLSGFTVYCLHPRA